MSKNENKVAMVISIGIDGKIVKVADACGEKLKKKPCRELDKLIDSATKSTSQSITVYHLVVNPCYVCIRIDRSCHWIEVPCWRDGKFDFI